jgi:hypothetical protein
MKNSIMKNSAVRSASCLFAGVLLASGTFWSLAGTGIVQGDLTAKTAGQTIAVGAMIEALNAVDATVAQTDVMDFDGPSASGSFSLTLPAGTYRLCFRFAASSGNYSDRRSYYAEAAAKPQYCFSEGTVVSIVEGTTTTIDALAGYSFDPVQVALTEFALGGSVTDAEGSPLSNIQVELLDSCSANVVFSTTTDEGDFKIERQLSLSSGKLRFSDPSGRYATSFYGDDNFVGAAPVPLESDISKVLQPRPQDIEVAPLSDAFGDVALPGSATAIITIANRGGVDLQVTSLVLADTGTPCITVKSAPLMPLTLTPGSSCEVLLEFEPQILGETVATLAITSDDPDEATVLVTLSGNGVASSAPPGEQIAATLDFMAESVNEGMLQGTGPGGAGAAHVQALMDQIKAASDLAAAGKLQPACKQLENAMQRTDGAPSPPDFVTGPAAEVLRLLIDLTRASMGFP